MAPLPAAAPVSDPVLEVPLAGGVPVAAPALPAVPVDPEPLPVREPLPLDDPDMDDPLLETFVNMNSALESAERDGDPEAADPVDALPLPGWRQPVTVTL